MIEDGVRGWLSNPGAICLHAAGPPRTVLQARAIFPDKLVASGAIGDLPLAVALTNIPFWEQEWSKSKVWTSPLITNYRLDGEG